MHGCKRKRHERRLPHYETTHTEKMGKYVKRRRWPSKKNLRRLSPKQSRQNKKGGLKLSRRTFARKQKKKYKGTSCTPRLKKKRCDVLEGLILESRASKRPQTLPPKPMAKPFEVCIKLGYDKEEPPPFTKAWRADKDNSKEKALILQFPTEIAKITFMKKKAILRGLKEDPPIYLDDDLTWLQREHRRACMPRIHKARKEGKKATYRDGRVIIDGKIFE